MSETSKDNRIKDLITKINGNPYFIFIVSVCSIIGFVFSLVSDNIIIKIIAIVLIFIIAILLIYKIFSRQNLEKAVSKKYEDILSEIYEIIESINFTFKKNFDNIKNKNIGTYEHLNSLLKPLSDSISDLAQIIIKERSSVCIKIIETESLMNNDFKKWKIRTIARSKSTKPNRQRKDNQAVNVSENSDFCTIIEGNDPNYGDNFIVPDLDELEVLWKEVGWTYLNSTKNYKNLYKSTIVFPIRTKADMVADVIKNGEDNPCFAVYHVIGFLCWDSKKKFNGNDKSFLELVDILESFADSLYPLLENYIVLQIQKKIPNDTAEALNG